MRKYQRAIRALVMVPIVVITLVHAAADEGPKPESQPSHASPNAVFEAYRDARAKGNFRRMFFLLTPEARESAVFESYFACQVSTKPQATAIQKQFGVGAETLHAEFVKQYYQRHGVDLSQWKTDPNNFKPFPRDDDLLRKVVADLIGDKVGFFEAVNNALGANPPEEIGPLEGLTVQGNSAEGRAGTHLEVITAGSGQPSRTIHQPIMSTFRFRSIDGSWFLVQ